MSDILARLLFGGRDDDRADGGPIDDIYSEGRRVAFEHDCPHGKPGAKVAGPPCCGELRRLLRQARFADFQRFYREVARLHEDRPDFLDDPGYRAAVDQDAEVAL